MPNIREYNSSESLQGIRPSELGADALAQSGRRIASVLHQAGEDLGGGVARIGQAADEVRAKIDQHDAMQEISTGAASLANITSQLTNDWNQTANQSDLNDHTVADKFREQSLEPAIEKWQQGFTTPAGQKWALERADALRSHMFEKTSADMATRAGDALVANLNTTLNASSNMARNDPSSMAFAMDQYESGLRAAAANSNAPAGVVSKAITEQLQKGKTQIAQSAMIGLAQSNPDVLDAEIAKGTYNDYIDGTQIKQMQAYAHSQRTQQQAEFRANSKDASDDYTSSLYDPTTQQVKPVTPGLIGKIMSDPRLTEGDKRGTVRFLQQQFKAQQREMNDAEHASDPQLLAAMRQRFATGDPKQYPTNEEIGDALGAGRLNSKDAAGLAKANELLAGKTARQDPATKAMVESTLKAAHAQISGGAPPGDYSAAQSAAVARFDSWFWTTYPRAIANNMNPQALLSPDSPDYMLKPETMKAFGIKGSDLVAPPTTKLPPGPRPPLSQFFGPKAEAPKQPAPPAQILNMFGKPATDQDIAYSSNGA